MELEILKLIYDYSINEKLADKEFIDKIIEIVVSKKSLNRYVKSLQFTELYKNDYEVACAAYDTSNMRISVDYESIQIAMKQYSYYDQLFHTLERTMFKNLTITQIILHELEHAFQNKQADNMLDNSIEAKLVRASFSILHMMDNPRLLTAFLNDEISKRDFIFLDEQYKKLYKKYYLINPSERLAQVNSFKLIIEVMKPIKEYIPNLYDFELASSIGEMVKGYGNSWKHAICPTQLFLFDTGQDDVWNGFDFYDQDFNQLIENVCHKYNLARRFQLGLPVSRNEYNTLVKCLQHTNKFSFIKYN